MFSSSTIHQIRLAKQNEIVLRQLRRGFDVKSTYLFGISADLINFVFRRILLLFEIRNEFSSKNLLTIKLVGARPLRGRHTHPILIHPSQH